MNNQYTGRRTSNRNIVTVNGERLDPRPDLRNHSPDGFEWGYHGSGPAQLALAILAHEYGDEIAEVHYQDFKRLAIGRLAEHYWTLTSQEIDNIMTIIQSTESQKS